MINKKVEPPYYETNEGSVKTYKGLITQSGVGNPNVVELTNTIGKIVWTREGAGEYLGTLEGAFPIGKTTMMSGNQGSSSGVKNIYIGDWAQPDQIFVIVEINGTPTDTNLSADTIEITVYP